MRLGRRSGRKDVTTANGDQNRSKFSRTRSDRADLLYKAGCPNSGVTLFNVTAGPPDETRTVVEIPAQAGKTN